MNTKLSMYYNKNKLIITTMKKFRLILKDFVLMRRLKAVNTRLKKLGLPFYVLNPQTNKIEIKDLNRSLRFNFTLGELIDMCKQLPPN